MTVIEIKEKTYSVQCTYIKGSKARGCVYILVSGVEEIFKNISGIIRIDSSEGNNIIEVFNIGCYREVLAYDLENNNDIGSLSVKGSINSYKSCSIAGM